MACVLLSNRRWKSLPFARKFLRGIMKKLMIAIRSVKIWFQSIEIDSSGSVPNNGRAAIFTLTTMRELRFIQPESIRAVKI